MELVVPYGKRESLGFFEQRLSKVCKPNGTANEGNSELRYFLIPFFKEDRA
jgi:hypothetical protein